MSNNASIKDTFYGCPIQYRIEKRHDKGEVYDTLILAFRDAEDSSLRYEHPPRRVNEWEKIKKDYQKFLEETEDSQGTTFLEFIPREIMQEFCQRFVGLEGKKKKRKQVKSLRKREKGEEKGKKEAADEKVVIAVEPPSELPQEVYDLHVRRRKELALPLAVLLLADKQYLWKKVNASDSTMNDRERAVKLLLKHEGSTRWDLVLPERCCRWLPRQSEHDQKECVRCIKRLIFYQRAIGIKVDEDWDNYVPTEKPKRMNVKQMMRENNEQQVFTDGQCRQIIQNCFDKLESKTKLQLRVALAVLLRLTLAIEPEELCALTFGDFGVLDDYENRYFVHINKEYRKGRKNYGTFRFASRHRERKLPLSYAARTLYLALRGDAGDREEDAAEKTDLPVFSSPSNPRRKMSPDDLEKEMDKFMKTWEPKRITNGVEVKLPTLQRVLADTAIQKLRTNGAEEEEVRRICGEAPLLVSARSYNDFVNKKELNKLGAIQDRWVSAVCPELQNQLLSMYLEKNRGTMWVTDTPGTCTCVRIMMPVRQMNQDRIPQGGAVIRLSALRGLSGRVSAQKNNMKEGELL